MLTRFVEPSAARLDRCFDIVLADAFHRVPGPATSFKTHRLSVLEWRAMIEFRNLSVGQLHGDLLCLPLGEYGGETAIKLRDILRASLETTASDTTISQSGSKLTRATELSTPKPRGIPGALSVETRIERFLRWRQS